MNKNIATGILIVLYIIGIILFPMLYYIASEYYPSRYFFIVAFPMSLFMNYIFLINIIIAKIIKKVKQVEAESQK